MFHCKDDQQLKTLSDLPKSLKEASGIAILPNSKLIWMINDGGNTPSLFGVSTKGKIKQKIAVNADNNDWEDLTVDPEGNLYIGDFGDNNLARKVLNILKITSSNLDDDSVEVQKISFTYPDKLKFSLFKKSTYHDCEAFFYFKNALYLFTKSKEKTSLYKVPAVKGNHIATLVSDYATCTSKSCSITSADISPDQQKVALLSNKYVYLLSNFKGDDFFSGDVKKITLGSSSQKESIVFKDNNTLYITDEKEKDKGGNFYEFNL